MKNSWVLFSNCYHFTAFTPSSQSLPCGLEADPAFGGSFFPFGLCHVLSRIDTGYTVWKECHANAATLLPVQRVYRAEDIAKSLWEMVPYTVAYYGTEISENS